MKLDHIGIAVKDLESSLKIYIEGLGLRLIKVEEVPEENVKVAMLDAGGVRIELLEGIGEDSAVRKYIEKRGEGIHHIAFKVDDVDKISEELKGKGFKLVYSSPKLVAGGSRKVNFIHPKS
ncbi:MAG: methylmalonyl-CoA epimerase, partial [Desulfurococcales archaeon]|nr:methylmalonyl-CoA epimerase [Desulfurococcales archaeon]